MKEHDLDGHPDQTMSGADTGIPPRGARFLEIVGGLLLMFVRSILLWLVIPIAFLAWVFVHGWAQHTRLRHALAWYDFNTVALLMNGPLRLMFRAEQRPPFVGVSHMGKGEWHRVSLNDLLDFSLE